MFKVQSRLNGLIFNNLLLHGSSYSLYFCTNLQNIGLCETNFFEKGKTLLLILDVSHDELYYYANLA